MKKKTIRETFFPFLMLICAILMNFTFMGILANSLSLYTPEILEEHPEFMRSSFVLTITLINLVAAFFNIFYTVFQKKLGIRGLLLIGTILMSSGTFLYSVSSSLPMFYLAAVPIGIASGMCGSTSAVLIINSWFAKRNGTFVSMAMAGTGIGCAIFSPIISLWIEESGWHAAVRNTAWIVLGIGFLLFLLYRNSPEEAGLSRKWGEAEAVSSGLKENADPVSGSRQSLLKSSRYRLVLLLSLLLGLYLYSIMGSLSVIAADLGYSTMQIGTFSSIIFASNVIMQLPVGMSCDQFGSYKVLKAAFLLMTCMLCLLLLGIHSFLLMAFIAFICGCSKTVMNNVPPFVVSESTTPEDRPRMVSYCVAAMSIGCAFGVYLVQAGFDLTGSYTAIYVLFLVLTVILFLLSRRISALNHKS